jgi:hypothetical protein
MMLHTIIIDKVSMRFEETSIGFATPNSIDGNCTTG